MPGIQRMIAFVMLSACVATPAWASQYVFPAQDQSPEQQAADEGECSQWATEQTGHDPSNPAAPPPAGKSAGSSAVRGAARGALAAFAIGSITGGDRSAQVGLGAALGGVSSGVSASKKNSQQQQAHAQQQSQKLGEYHRARAACLEAKGYTVK